MNAVAIAIFAALIAAVLVLLVTNLLNRGGRSRKAGKSLSDAQTANAEASRWRAVKIAPGLISCDAVNTHADRVFLASSAPRLPLEGCDEQQCRCKYIHLEDRRSGGDRRIHLGDLGAFLPANQVERRHSRGRRVADAAA